MKVYIYTLSSPDSNDIRYVGKTTNLKQRLANHLHFAKKGKKYRLYNWIRKLIKDGLLPIMNIIEECSSTNWQDRESYWIEFYKSADLCNMTPGGEGANFTANESFIEEKIQKVNQAIELIKNGVSQKEAEKTVGLHNGYISMLRAGDIKYLSHIDFDLPITNRTSCSKHLRDYQFPKGITNNPKNSGKGYSYQASNKKWIVKGYKDNKRVTIGLYDNEEEAIEARKQYLEQYSTL